MTYINSHLDTSEHMAKQKQFFEREQGVCSMKSF